MAAQNEILNLFILCHRNTRVSLLAFHETTSFTGYVYDNKESTSNCFIIMGVFALFASAVTLTLPTLTKFVYSKHEENASNTEKEQELSVTSA